MITDSTIEQLCKNMHEDCIRHHGYGPNFGVDLLDCSDTDRCPSASRKHTKLAMQGGEKRLSTGECRLFDSEKADLELPSARNCRD